MASFGFDGHKIAFEQRGRRNGAAQRPIVLIHGLLLPRKHHYPLADTLASRGNRVILVDLLGHGESDRPPRSRMYSMELFGQQVVGLLDHLDIPEAVIGGTSLGANVTLEVAHHQPDRARALVLEMPVLEHASLIAGGLFLPLAVAYTQFPTFFEWWGALVNRFPRGWSTYGDVLLDTLAQPPSPAAAVLRGLATGRQCLHPSDREKLEHRALIMGHRRDLLHPLTDAETLAVEMKNAELVQSSSLFELRFPPNRLSDRLCDFLDDVWAH